MRFIGNNIDNTTDGIGSVFSTGCTLDNFYTFHIFCTETL